MRFLSGVRAILFDLDGTLVDTAPDITAAVGATLHDLDRPPIDDAAVRSYIGRGVDVLLHRVLTGARDGNAAIDVHEQAREIFLEHYAAHNGRTASVYPGVREGIAHAQSNTGTNQVHAEEVILLFSDPDAPAAGPILCLAAEPADLQAAAGDLRSLSGTTKSHGVSATRICVPTGCRN